MDITSSHDMIYSFDDVAAAFRRQPVSGTKAKAARAIIEKEAQKKNGSPGLNFERLLPNQGEMLPPICWMVKAMPNALPA